ncbi:DUF3592 domain-containing protein [Streptomyces sp. NPDC001262]|uniref:DUF3592 domain-containing protein n=1 Tax=unclassified Streptomyces TaxID=2593676 RepID=UPI0036C50A60
MDVSEDFLLSWFGGHVLLAVNVFATLVLLGALVLPFGVRPLLVDRRLRSAGVTVRARCTGVNYRSEGRISEAFSFRTLDGRNLTYNTPLRDGRIADTGEVLEIVYDPRSPARRARTARELSEKSPARFNLWGGIALIALGQLFCWGFSILRDRMIH